MKQIKILMVIIFSILSATLNCPPEVNSINFDSINVSAKPDPAKKAPLPSTAEKAKITQLPKKQLLEGRSFSLINNPNFTKENIPNIPTIAQRMVTFAQEFKPFMSMPVKNYLSELTTKFPNATQEQCFNYLTKYFETHQNYREKEMPGSFFWSSPTKTTDLNNPIKITFSDILTATKPSDNPELQNLWQELVNSNPKQELQIIPQPNESFSIENLNENNSSENWDIQQIQNPSLKDIQKGLSDTTQETLQSVVDTITNGTEYAKNNTTNFLINPALNFIDTGITTAKNTIDSTKTIFSKNINNNKSKSLDRTPAPYSYQFTQKATPKIEEEPPLLLTYTPEWHARDIAADGTKTDLMKKQELDTLFGENKLSDMKNFEKINVSEKNATDQNNLANENQPFTPEIQTALKTSTIPTLTKSTVGNFMYTACRKTARSIRNTPQAVKQFINKFITTLSYMLNLTKEETVSLQNKAELEANKLIADKQSWLYAKQDFDIKFAEWTNNIIDSFNKTIGRKNKSSSMQMISIDTQTNNLAAPKLNLITDGDMVTSAQIIYKGHSYFVDPANIQGPDITGNYSITTDLVKEPKNYNPLEKTYQFAYNLVQGSIFHSLKESPAGNKAEQDAPGALDKVQEFITPNGQPSEGKLTIEFNNQYKTLKTEIRQPQENAIIAINTTHDLKGKSKPITSITIADNHTNTFTPTVSFDINANNGQIIDNPSVSHTITNTQGIKTTIRATSNTIRQLQDGRYIIESTFTYPEKPKLTYTQQFMQSIFSQTPKLLNDIITNIREGYTLSQIENKVADTIGRDKISEQINDVITYLFSANETQIEKVMTSYDPITNKITTWVTNQMSDGTSKMVTTNYTLFDQTKSSTNNQTTPTIPTKSNFILQQPRKLQNEKSLL
ncbi:MAG: hypothetical protein ACXWL2_00835 [Candidatus Chromulinivorax sp.]